jgi:asparagine synthase (glutamine-hydrolysing)
MCGILAIFNSLAMVPWPKAFDAGVKRGPDRSNMKMINNQILFGFHRLAIHGLNDDKANQPMTINGITLICNGEIYNYKTLFEQHDINPKTESDCEIIIRLYEKKGIAYVLENLDGVFAFTLHDAMENVVYVARDRFGVRPLYQLKVHDTVLAFASELKVLMPLIDEFDDAPPQIKHVLPSTYLELRPNKQGNWIIYKSVQLTHESLMPPNIYGPYNGVPDYIHICLKLSEAVKKRVEGLQGHTSIACLLSGGLDSSLIAALVKKYAPTDLTIETYSIGMAGSQDLVYAQIVADHLGTKHTSLVLTEDDFFNAIPEVITAIESYDTTTVRASVGNYLIGKYIKANSRTKIVFNGDGSDELMGGYLYFHAAPDPEAFDNECRRLLGDIYLFDVLRSDKCISSHGLEPRTPFLDRDWVKYYLSIPAAGGLRMPAKKHIEKELLRVAFAQVMPDLLPNKVLWRTKEAFSDGVSGLQKAWYEIVQEQVKNKNLVPDNYDEEFVYPLSTRPTTREQAYYRGIYEEAYPGTADLVPYFWLPRFIKGVTDASARTLDLYKSRQT